MLRYSPDLTASGGTVVSHMINLAQESDDRLLIIAKKFGQLGNRLLFFAHVIAAAREFGARVANPSFVEYARYFQAPAEDAWCRYPPESCRLPANRIVRELIYQSHYLPTKCLASLGCVRWPRRILRNSGSAPFDMDEKLGEILEAHRRVYLQGWGFTAPRALEKHADAVRDYFRPLEVHQQAARRAVKSARRDADVVVGVHIRRGDYREFEGGRYYYDISDYRTIMSQLARNFMPQRVSFLVCSNERLAATDLGGVAVSFGPGHLVEDLDSLAGCDYLIGPPSTFSMWASFYGKVPLRMILNASDTFDPGDFVNMAA